MASSINSRMAAIGRTYPKTYPPTQRYIGITNRCLGEGALDKLMGILHAQVREQVKKNLSGQRY